ncbi:MAG TPA: ABC transporter substrate-binding protein [Ktedonobacterales bacterium]
MPDLPTGTVTFLFTDIEGSTKLLQRAGEQRYGELRADHERLLRQAWADHHGYEVDTQGDAFFVVFAHATDALAAAAQAQRATLAHPWPGGERVRVRMGLHTGAGVVAHDHYVGLDVNRAARICAAGHGGQVLLSQATRDQVAKELAAGEGIRDLGKHRLKDLPRREAIYQLTLPGMPRDFPPLKTLDAWPGYRADLLAALVGLALPYAIPVFPRAIGVGAAGVALLLAVGALVARPLRRWLASEWRSARKPVAAVTSALLSLVVVSTTLFITKPEIFVLASSPKHLGYDFSYVYHKPTHRGGQVTIAFPIEVELGFNFAGPINLWQSCIIQLPDTALGLDGWKADQCAEVPTIDNGGESFDLRTTTLHIDPRAVWSDGVPLTADDFRFEDNVSTAEQGMPTAQQRTLLVPDPHTLIIHWAHQYGDFLSFVENLAPWPLHALATGKLAGVYDPKTGHVNVALANQLLTPYFAPQWVGQTYFNAITTTRTFPVLNGPFLVQSSVLYTSVTLTRNPRFFSNFFHTPALDQVTVISENPHSPLISHPPRSPVVNALINDYRNGSAGVVEGLTVVDARQVGGIPTTQRITSPTHNFEQLAFNERAAAPNAQLNGGVSIFANRKVRQAFVEAFDRCGALRAQLGISSCDDPNVVTDELTTPVTADYDPSFKLPAYSPVDAARLLTEAGYPVVDNIRRAQDGKTPLQISINILSFSSFHAPIIIQRMKQDYERNLKITVDVVMDTTAFDTAPYGQPGLPSGTFDILVYGEANLLDLPNSTLGSTIIGAPDAQDIPSANNPYTNANLMGIIDPYIVEKETEGQLAPPGPQSDLLFRNLERYVAGQYYAEPFFIDAGVALVKPTICNYKKYPSWFLDNAWNISGNEWNIADWYVAPSCPS